MDIKFNVDIPGYATYEECITICNIIDNVDFYSVLEVGSYTGRLTWSLCQTFIDKQITALDTWDGGSYIDRIGSSYWNSTERDQRYFGKTNTVEMFNVFNKHDNLKTVQTDFYNYKTAHDVIILSADAEEIIWENLIDHALSLGPKLIIGRHAHHHRIKINEVLESYEIERYDPHGVYIVKHKKVI